MRVLRSALLFSCVATALVAADAPQRIVVSETPFETAGRTIHVDHFESGEPGNHPRILVLHGAGGMIFDGPEMRRVARYLAEQGNSVDLIHYFNRTGDVFARDAAMQTHFEEWLDTVRTAVSRAAGESCGRVGIYGYSLGAFLAVAAASDNPKVAAVVEQAGGIWNNKFERIGRMPPVLVVHGRADQRVPFSKYAEPLIARLRAHGGTVRRRIFPSEGHVFTAAAMSEVKPAAQQFFDASRPSPGKR